MKKCFYLFLLLLLPVSALAEVHLRIDKVSMTMSVFDDDTLMATYPIACGKNKGHKQKSGDMRTPEGTFTITQIVNARSWSHDFKDGKGVIPNAYGPWFFRLSFGSGIGIHGTHDPESMGKRATEGCIRLRNEDLLKLKPLVKIGTVVEILPDK